MFISCPICQKKVEWKGNPFRPFCSERCKLTDLGQWATDSYRIPASEEKEGEEAPDQEEEKGEGAEEAPNQTSNKNGNGAEK
ncbi:MAG TPA: DNA gyrase inhibitor YacG [Candidatus Manganitrophaceae bacterium]|nr:DNA gyrase inhibitor YacG [Candidatus Manganitrophaceae bacterium]